MKIQSYRTLIFALGFIASLVLALSIIDSSEAQARPPQMNIAIPGDPEGGNSGPDGGGGSGGGDYIPPENGGQDGPVTKAGLKTELSIRNSRTTLGFVGFPLTEVIMVCVGGNFVVMIHFGNH